MVLSLESVDPTTVEVVRSMFGHIAREMKSTIHKTAYSATIQEAQDYSIVVFRGADAVAFEYGIPAHVGAMPRALQEVLQDRKSDGGLADGDVVLWNLPYYGGSHTPDVSCMKCVEVDGVRFYPIVRAHWSDVGGMTPGSLSGKVTEIFQEGLLMPPIKISKNNTLNGEVFRLIMANMRLPFQRKGDLRAEIAACDVAEARLREMCQRYGTENVDKATDIFLAQTEQRTLEKLRKIPPGEYEYEDYLDSDGHSTEPYRIHAVCRVTRDGVNVDFEGTSEQAKGPVNTVLATTESGVIVTLKCMLDPHWPLNQGFFRPITVHAPEGTIVNCRHPAPTGSVWEVVIRISDTLIGALAGAVENIAAPGLGAINHTFMGGAHPKTGRPYVWYEGPKAGAGATDHTDGEDALSHIGVDGDTKDWAIERGEFELPVEFLRYEMRPDSGGAGKYSGGLGLIRELVVYDSGRRISSLWDRCKIPTFGLFGGYGGAPSRVYITRKDGSRYLFPIEYGSKAADVPIEFGEVLTLETTGGGGFGDPLERDPKMVAEDLRLGRISPYTANKIHGIVLNSNDMEVDLDATEIERSRLKEQRVICKVKGKDEEFAGRKRSAAFSPNTIERMGVKENEPLEVLGMAAAPLRLWPKAHESYDNDEVGLDETSMRILRVKNSDRVWVRDPFLVFRQRM